MTATPADNRAEDPNSWARVGRTQAVKEVTAVNADTATCDEAAEGGRSRM